MFDGPFDDKLPQATAFSASMCLYNEKHPTAIDFYLWAEDGADSRIIWSEILDFDVAIQHIAKCFQAGVRVMATSSSVQDYLIIEQFAEMPDDERENWLIRVYDFMHPETVVTNGS